MTTKCQMSRRTWLRANVPWSGASTGATTLLPWSSLIWVRTLAEAGVPLSRVHVLLAAGEAEFVAAVLDIDR